MLSKKLKWYLLFEDQQEMEDLFGVKPAIVHRTMFGEVLLVKNKNEFSAFKNKCPHQGKSLEDCWIENDKVVCPFHQYHYSIENGRGQGLYLEKYELKFENKQVFIGKEVWSLF